MGLGLNLNADTQTVQIGTSSQTLEFMKGMLRTTTNQKMQNVPTATKSTKVLTISKPILKPVTRRRRLTSVTSVGSSMHPPNHSKPIRRSSINISKQKIRESHAFLIKNCISENFRESHVIHAILGDVLKKM